MLSLILGRGGFMGREKRRRYSKQFKAGAVSLVMEQDYGTPEAAKCLGINANMLNRWLRM